MSDKILAPTPDAIRRAGELIRAGGTVVIPTETVYGLAANALDEQAVESIFRIKGRPADNPLIVHISETASVHQLVKVFPREAEMLAQKFWPGPLTLVLEKSMVIPRITTGGLDTVALRVPENVIARQIIAAAGMPLAAPSANPFTAVSPTCVEHLAPSIVSQVDLIIDGGPSKVGIESTVVDLSGDGAVLRPGAITKEQIERVIGRLFPYHAMGVRIKAPGQYPKHYSPHAEVKLVERASGFPGLVFGTPGSGQIQMPMDPNGYAEKLYGALHQLDDLGYNLIEVELPPTTPEWAAVNDRLRRSSASG